MINESHYGVLDALEMIDYKKHLLKKSEKVSIDDPIRLAQILLGRGIKEVIPEISTRRNKYSISLKSEDEKCAYIISIANSIARNPSFFIFDQSLEDIVGHFTWVGMLFSNRHLNIVEHSDVRALDSIVNIRIYSLPFKSLRSYRSNEASIESLIYEYGRRSYKAKMEAFESISESYKALRTLDIADLKGLFYITRILPNHTREISTRIGRPFAITRELILNVGTEYTGGYDPSWNRLVSHIVQFYGESAPAEEPPRTVPPQRRAAPPQQQEVSPQELFDAILLNIVNQRRNEA